MYPYLATQGQQLQADAAFADVLLLWSHASIGKKQRYKHGILWGEGVIFLFFLCQNFILVNHKF